MDAIVDTLSPMWVSDRDNEMNSMNLKIDQKWMIFLFIVTTIGLYNYISWYTYRQDLNRYETNSFSTGDPTLNRVCIDLNDNYESNAYFKDRLGLIYNIGKENDTYKIFITPYNNLPVNTVNKDCFPNRNVIYYIEPYIIRSSNNLFLAIVIIFFHSKHIITP